MDAKKDNLPLKGSKPRGTLSRSVHIAEGAHPERSGRSTLSQRGVSAAPSASVLKPPSTPATLSQEEKEAIQKRAEGRAKVPPKFRDSVKRFFFSPTGALKIIRLGLLIGAFIFFIIAEAPESYIAITILETCIVVFFILIYMLTLQHLMTYLHWPLLDLINSFITAVFLLIVAILAIQEKERRHLFYIGGALCLTAATVCVIDATLVTKTMRNNLKKALGIKMETSRPLTPEPTPPTRTPTRGGPNAPTRAAMKPRSRRGQAPSKAPSPEPSWTPMKTPPTPSSGGSRR
nr:CKLF-like MARVEL transmembrane domain-containing protein 1 isoform X1 [Odocoileus virginianus texanus]